MTASRSPQVPTAREWAEALWLASRTGADPAARPPAATPPGAQPAAAGSGSAPPGTGEPGPGAADPGPLPEPGEDAGTAPDSAPKAPVGQRPVPGPGVERVHGVLLSDRAPSRSPAPQGPPGTAAPVALAPASGLFQYDHRPGVLREPLRLARALRPFNRRVLAGRRTALDEEATAVRTAEAGRWTPVVAALPDRWFEIALVVEESVSMAVWHGVTRELSALLERQGAFGDVRVWRLDTQDGKSAVLRAERGGPARDPGELLHPQGRRLILLVSDCVGDAWAGGAVPRLLHTMASQAPTAVVQPLPGRMWERCEAVPVDLRLRATTPGLANARLQVRRGARWARPGDTGGPVPVPVLEMEPAWFSGWARLVTAEATPWSEAAALMVEGSGLAHECLPPFLREERSRAVPPERAVRHFLNQASPAARGLARQLAMVPLVPDVVEAVRRHVVPTSGPLPFAEIVLGGLLAPAPGRPGPVYEFLDGVRGRLLRGLGRAEILRTLQEVTAVAGAATGARPGLLGTLIATPGDLDTVPLSEQDRELLDAAGVALSVLGPSYRRVWERVTIAAAAGGQDSLAGGGTLPAAAGGAPAQPGSPRPDTPATNTKGMPMDPAAPHPGPDTLEPGRPRRTDGTGSGSGADGPGSPGGTLPGGSGAHHSPPGRPPRAMPMANAHFAGREAELTRLHDLLNDGGSSAVLPHALYGMGGVGKTRLAVEYVQRHHQEYDRVWWIDAEQTAVIRQQIGAIAEELGAARGPGDPVGLVLSALRSGDPFRRWLMVMDNAGAPDGVVPYIPSMLGVPGGVGHVLITSRHAGWAERVRALRVDVLPRAESVAFLRNRAPWPNEQDADRLAESLGDLPLALEHCAALQSETGIGAQDCLELIETQRAQILAEPTSTGAQPVTAVWRASTSALREQNPGALELLRLLAFFGDEPIARSFLHDARLLSLPGALSAVVKDPLDRGRAIRAINQYSLLSLNSKADTVQVHRLLRGVLQDEMSEERREAMRHLAHQVIAAHDPGDSQRPENLGNYADILPHMEPSGLLRCADRQTRATVIGILGYVIARGDFRGAAELAGRVAATWRVTLGPDDLQTLWAMRQQASAHWQLSEFDRSRKINEEVLTRLRATVGDDHEYTLTVAGATAADLRAAGRFTDALELDRDAYERSTRIYGPEDPYALTVGHNYGVSLRVNGLYAEALALDRRIHQARVAVLGATARSTLFSINNVARDLRECGKYEESAEIQGETLRQYRSEYGNEHPHTLRAIKNMSVTCRKAGQFEQGLALAQEVLTLYRRQFGPEHLDTMAAQANLANDLRVTGDPHGARKCSGEALRRYRAVLGESHPLTYAVAVNHGAALRATGEYAEAHRIDRSTVSGLATVLGQNHPWLLLARVNLGTDLARAGDAEQAREHSADAARELTARYGDRHPATLAASRNLALDMTECGDTQQGADLLDSVRHRYLATLGADHPESRAAAAGARAECDIEPPPL